MAMKCDAPAIKPLASIDEPGSLDLLVVRTGAQPQAAADVESAHLPILAATAQAGESYKQGVRSDAIDVAKLDAYRVMASRLGVPDKPHLITLLVRRAEEPGVISVEEKTFAPGKLEGDLLLWSYVDGRFVCGAHVAVESSESVLVEDRPRSIHHGVGASSSDVQGLNARSAVWRDLQLQAFNSGISQLRSL
jgi:hypothetical protein